MAQGSCSVEGCDAPVQWSGLCRRCYKQAEYRRNREGYLRRAKEWSDRNPEARRKVARDYAQRRRAQDPDAARQRARASMAKWRTQHPDLARERKRQHYAANSQRYIDRAMAWARENPEQFRAIQRNRDLRKRTSGRGVTANEWVQVLEAHEHRCAYCGITGIVLQMDHVVPIARGGPHDIENVVPACRRCNQRKHTKTADEFRALLRDAGLR